MSTNPYRSDYDPHAICQRPEVCECPECSENAQEAPEHELEHENGKYFYRGYWIESERASGLGGMSYCHEDYDGPEDIRCGLCKDVDEARELIDELEESIEDGTAIWPQPDAWSGGFAENH